MVFCIETLFHCFNLLSFFFLSIIFNLVGSWMNEVASTVYQNDRRENEPFPGMKNRPVIYYQDEGDTEGNKRVLTSNRSSARTQSF